MSDEREDQVGLPVDITEPGWLEQVVGKESADQIARKYYILAKTLADTWGILASWEFVIDLGSDHPVPIRSQFHTMQRAASKLGDLLFPGE